MVVNNCFWVSYPIDYTLIIYTLIIQSMVLLKQSMYNNIMGKKSDKTAKS